MNPKIILSAGLLPAAAASVSGAVPKSERPNIVFFMAEDLARTCFELYQGYGAKTPFLEEMAGHGVVFNNAYSNAPVSSAARSSVITGCYAPAYGLSSHRKLEPVVLPENIWLFPHYLREAGYFTTNASKTDYNCVMDKQAWDLVKGKMGDWRRRNSPDQPFFHCFSINACHESCLHFPDSDLGTVPTEHDPDSVRLYPFHPDTELFRYTYARLYDKIKYVDSVLGEMLAMLREDGLLDNTFVFYMGDNGGCVPFSKSYTNEQGLNVPLVVYIPDNWKDDVAYAAGDRADGFVEFLDLAPTVLALAGIDVPGHMDGRSFLGPEISREDVESRDVVFCYGDRFDELYAVNRTVRKGDFKYSRNYLPHQPKGMFCAYRYKQAAFRQWREMFDNGELDDIQSAFYLPQGAEELYDLSSDPYETVNLAGDPAFAGKLEEMRGLLKDRIMSEQDLVLVPEAFWLDHTDDIVGFRESIGNRLGEYYDAAELERGPFRKVHKEIRAALDSDDPIVRYWAVTACCGFGKEARSLEKEIRSLLEDDCTVVKSRAALYCVANGMDVPDNVFKTALASSENEAATLMVLNDMAFLYENVGGFSEEISEIDLKYLPNAYGERLKFFKRHK